jgi:Polyketide cyclase / dehydrase and lipid transport
MTGSVSCRVEQLSSAKPAVVYDVLMDVERWSDWMPTVSAASWERRGEPDTGRGGIRRVHTGISVTRDRVVGGARPRHHAYAASLPRYWPLKNYQGDIRIEERLNGCLIIWTVTCESPIPGLGKSLQSRLCAVYSRLAAALAQEAERTGPCKRETHWESE